MVDNDGKNRYPQDENWLTDGYGDYVRHYLNAMAAEPALAPADEEHLLYSSSVIQQVDYAGNINKFLVPQVKNVDLDKVRVYYHTFDNTGAEKIRLLKKPSLVLLNDKPMTESAADSPEGFTWQAYAKGGLLTIKRLNGNKVIVLE
jgi:hypothetical protein